MTIQENQKKRVKRFLKLNQLVNSVLFGVSLFMFFTGVMSSERSSIMEDIFYFSVVSFPLVIIFSLISSSISYKNEKYEEAIWLSLLPYINLLLIILMSFLGY